MPTLPAGHVVLMAFSWLSMILYVCIIWTIIRWRKYVYFLRSSYYYLLVLQAFIDFHMFLTVELIMRPRKFNFFNLFSSHMLIYAKFTYMNLFVSNTAFAFCHLFIALNRLTAFYSPLLHNKVWSEKTVAMYGVGVYVLSLMSALPLLFVGDGVIMFHLLPDGIIQLFSDDYIERIIQKRLLLCALWSFIPFCFEFIRSIFCLFSSLRDITPVYLYATQVWFYEMEIITSLSPWLQILLNKNVRVLMFEAFNFRKSVGISIVVTSLDTKW